jgi:general secretion pathway protein F
MLFTIRSIDAATKISTHTLDAPSLDLATKLAAERGLRVLSINGGASMGLHALRLRKPNFPVVQFCQDLLTLLNSGLALVDSIETLNEKETRLERKAVLGKLVSDLFSGSALSTAIAQFPDSFPPLLVATVRASERTGGLAEALEKYVTYQKQLDTVKKKIISASIYPVLLMVVGSLVIAFLLGYVVPKFATIFEDLGGDVPWMSKLLIQWGHIAKQYGTAILISAGLAVVGLGVWLSQPGTAVRIFETLQKIPGLGERMRVYQLARFYRSLGMLLRGGMPAVASLELVSGLLPGALNRQLTNAIRMIREGTPISNAMEKTGLTTAVSARMLRVGERTGQMGEMMERIALFYDAEISQWVDWFVKLFEPLLMTFIGVVIGLIVLVMYLPIFELAGSIR